MDEAEHDRQEEGQGRSLLPALVFAWAATYFVIGLAMTVFWGASWTRDWPDGALRIHACMLGLGALLFLRATLRVRSKPPAEQEPEAWLCQHCLKPYVPGAHFCPRCSAPKTFYSGTLPFERAHAQAWILAKAGHHPSRCLHLVGLVLVFLGAVTQVGPSFVLWAQGSNLHSSWHHLVYAVPVIVYACCCGALLAFGWRAWRRRVRGEPPIRPEIEYGSPPWFSYDAEWALPEYEEEPEGEGPEATPAAG